jgi:hypothetical protein
MLLHKQHLDRNKIYSLKTQQCTPLLLNQGPLLVCYWSPQPHSAYNSHKIGKYDFIKLLTASARLNPQNCSQVAAEVT